MSSKLKIGETYSNNQSSSSCALAYERWVLMKFLVQNFGHGSSKEMSVPRSSFPRALATPVDSQA